MPLSASRRQRFLRGLVGLLLVLVLVACGSGPTPAPPKATVPLDVGQNGDGGAVVRSAPVVAQTLEAGPLPIASNDPVRGSRQALVTIVVFSDFQCPFCSRHAATLDRLRETYRDDLRVVFKNQPLSFHPYARFAAEVGQAVLLSAGQEAFWRYHDMAFQNQRGMSREAILSWAQASGSRADVAPEDARVQQKVDEDSALGTTVGANGTPMSFVNGTLVGGAQPFEVFVEKIDAELARARALEATGVPRDRLYVELTKNATFKSEDDEDDDADAKAVFKIPVAGAPARGERAPTVTIVEFSDFQCPYCRRASTTLRELEKQFPTDLRIVWRDAPGSSHPFAMPAALLARAARAQKGDAGFWDVHDRLFAMTTQFTDLDLERIATEAKLDVKKALADVRASTHKRAVESDLDLADDFGARSTPTFFVNGRKVVGAKPLAAMKQVVEEELRKASAIEGSGTPRAQLYDAITKNGTPSPPPIAKNVSAAPPGAPFRGAATGKAVIQVFSDFECPACARIDAQLDEVLKELPGKVKIVYRDYPLSQHTHAMSAANLAREAHAQKGNEGYAKMKSLLMANQVRLERQDLEGYARTLGLDAAKVAKALDTEAYKPAIERDKEAGTALGLARVPAVFVGRYVVVDASPRAIRRLVERVLAEGSSGGSPSPAAL